MPLLASCQCYPDRHNTTWNDAWVSCQAKLNPNSVHGESHWILYDLSRVYKLGASHIWNINDPRHLDDGLQEVAIDYSTDGVNWQNLDTVNFEQGTGKSIYEGFSGPDFDEIVARYVLLTAVSNYGGNCFGFSELRVEREEISTDAVDINQLNSCFTANIYPMPFNLETTVHVVSQCEGEISYNLVDLLGKIVLNGSIPADANGFSFKMNAVSLDAGNYLLELNQNGVEQSYRLSVVR